MKILLTFAMVLVGSAVVAKPHFQYSWNYSNGYEMTVTQEVKGGPAEYCARHELYSDDGYPFTQCFDNYKDADNFVTSF